MTTRALLFTAVLATSVAALAADRSAGFISGVWQGDANYDQDGKFRDCTMTAQSESGILLGFVISKDYDWGLVLADDTRSFEVGTTKGVLLLVDGREPIAAVAKVVDVHGILIPLDNSDPVVQAMREGEVLTIVTDGLQMRFKLTGTNDAIAALAACVKEHLGTERLEL
jgi:hypothetical protein